MLINMLIRTSYRPVLFNRLLQSINTQTHKNLRIIVSYDDERALEYIPENIDKVRVYKDESKPFFYDNYCNKLKSMVTSGFFMFIDDDEVLASNDVLERLCKYLKNYYGVICQFSRNGNLKPSNELIKLRQIKRCKIGMPCIVLHHSCKNICDFDGSVGAADFHWIKAITKKVKLNFVSLVVAVADRRSCGVMEA